MQSPLAEIAMHELSIAQSILEIVNANLPAHEAHHVASVNVKVGEMSGVVPESLKFCFEAIIQGTPLQGAELSIEAVPFVLECNSCRNCFESKLGSTVCPSCGSADAAVISGTELQVVEIVLRDVEPVDHQLTS